MSVSIVSRPDDEQVQHCVHVNGFELPATAASTRAVFSSP